MTEAHMGPPLDPGFAEFEELPPEVGAIRQMKAAKKSMNVHQRLAQAMSEVTYIQKDPKAKGQVYSVVTHDKVTAKVRPALLDAGIVYYPQNMTIKQDGNRTEMTLDLKFVNIDNPEDFFLVPCAGYGNDNQDKGPGKSISYCVKMGLLKTLGLETGEDPDLDQKSVHEPEAPQLAPDGTPIPTLEYALVSCKDSIAVITGSIDAYLASGDPADLSAGSEAVQELTGGEKIALWVAPKKHPKAPFTTKHREIMKSPEFRQAHFGEDNE